MNLGIQLCMFVYCANYLWTQRKIRKHSFYILAFIISIFIVETIFVAVQARTVQICYIDNRVNLLSAKASILLYRMDS